MSHDPDTSASHPSPSPAAVSETELRITETEAHLGEAQSVIKNHVIAAMGVGLVPLPLVDLAGLAAIQLKMVHGLANHFHVPFTPNLGRSLITTAVGGALPITATMTASSLLKWLPAIGSLAGGTSVAVLSGGVTYALGQILLQHFQSGGTLANFDGTSFYQAFRREMDRGKRITRDLMERSSHQSNDT